MSDNLTCPGCAGQLEVMRSGTRPQGTSGGGADKLPHQPATEFAKCRGECGRTWKRPPGRAGWESID